MWPRLCEIAVALWLFVGPAFFPGPERVELITRVVAAAVLIFSAGSLLERFRRAYLGTFAVSLGIIAWVLMQPSPVAPAFENLMVSGLLLAMFAILPPEDNQPPRAWRRFEDARDAQKR
ncbi:MAG: hypothetical protein ACRD2J_10265 [Thermoanaerobaculia bacterium]